MNENLQTKLIDFEGDKLLGVKTEDGRIFLGVKKACVDIGLSENQARNEIKKVQNNLLFTRHKSVINLSVKFDTQYRDTILLEEKDIPIWLAQITLTSKMQKDKPETIEKILLYQDKCAKVLHEAFMSTEEQKQEFFNDMGLKGEIVELKGQLKKNTQQLINTENKLNTLIDSSTINSRQAQKLLHCAKDRVGTILGGAHSSKYKKESRMYFKNLWLSFCREFEVNTYKDLNPLNYNDGFRFIENWSMM